MIELKIICPSCNREMTGDHGKIELDLVHGEMNVECEWCSGELKLGVNVLEAPLPRSRKDYMPLWKQEMLDL